jgi:hypothetical protein
MAVSAQFAATPRIAAGSVSTADTSRTAPSTVATVLTAGSAGTRIDNIDAVATGTTVASTLRLWLYDGTTYRLWQEVPVLAITPGSGIPVWTWSVSAAAQAERMPLVLPTGWSLRATINDATAGGINVIARGGDF